MKNYINSFKPITLIKYGRDACCKFNIPKFLDGSIRTEPSFNFSFPAITSCCRPQFVKKLNVGDRVIYTTVKMKNVWHIVAALEVIYVAENHQKAAQWYKDNNLPLPTNIMVKNNKHVDLEKTVGIEGAVGETVEEWNEWYLDRSKECSKVAICKPIYLNIDNPISLTKQEYLKNFGKIFGTQNPAKITDNEFDKFIGIVK